MVLKEYRDKGKKKIMWWLLSANNFCYVKKVVKDQKQASEQVNKILQAWQDNKTSFSISLQSLKLTIFIILFTKHDAIDNADQSSMQDPCHIWASYRGLAHHRVSVAKWTIFLIPFTKHDTINIANPSSMRDACHICGLSLVMQYFPSLLLQNWTTTHIVSSFDWPFLIDSFTKRKSQYSY